MNHAVFCVTPSARPSSCEDTEFLELASSHTAGTHLSQPRGESSKIVPTLSENCCLQPLHFHIRRVEMNDGSLAPQRGHATFPSGQRIEATKSKARSWSEKYATALSRVV